LTGRPLPGFVLAAAVALTACSAGPPPVDPSSPEVRAAALAKGAEDDVAEGRLRDGLDGYREAARLVPGEDKYQSRAAELRAAFVTSLQAEAEAALARGDLASARRSALALVEVDPDSPAGYHVLASAAEAEGRLEDAWAAAQTAHARAPADAALAEALASLAMKTSRFAEAEALYGGLAKSSRAMRERQAAARLEFRVQNLPDMARKAAAAPRITRAQLSTLLVTLVPEVASARVPPGADVAIDALDRPERGALVKAIALGFFSVSKETHLVGADAPVLRSEMPGQLRRLAALLRGRDDACFVAPAALATCGILPDTASRQVSGREAFAAIDLTLRLAR
jgi:tetratricopeptide (TPR) repeat protein